MRTLAPLILALSGLFPAPVQPRPPHIWAGLPPGAHAIGFSTAIERDLTRQLDGAARPVQVACWYPATASSGPPMRYRDYFVLGAAERGPATAAAERAALDEEHAFFKSVGVEASIVDRWLDAAMFARKDAAPLRRPFPLVLVAQGNGQSAHHQAVLSEFLASHGFIVCTTPSQARLGDVMKSEADVLTSATAQASDMAIAERHARARFAPRPGPPALVGHSFGARSALLYAARHGAAALVSLDGGIGAAEARAWVDGASIDRARFKTPILHIYEEGDRAITPDMGLIRNLAGADRTLVKIDGIRHIDFTSLGFGAAAVPGLTGLEPPTLGARLRVLGACILQFIERAIEGKPFAPRVAPEWVHVERIARQDHP